MKWSQWLEQWGLSKLKINAGFLALQQDLRIYTAMLGDMAGVEEDLTLLEQVNGDS